MSHLPSGVRTYHDVIRHWAQTHPERLAFDFLQSGDVSTATLDYGGLDRKARAVAAELQQRGLRGRPVLLQYRPSLDFIVAFFGCLYAGAIAVSAYPPTGNRSKSDRLRKLMASCEAQAILTNAETLPDLEGEVENGAALQRPLICTDQLEAGLAEVWRATDLGEDDIAFLQYSSGSTGDPKGVIVSHGNLLHNQSLIRSAMGNGAHTVFASWLPLFHDMGLIGNVMQPLYLGVPCHLMPPMAFLQNPLRWLRVISEHGVTCTGGPNFAYDLCVDKVAEEDRAGLDLSSWQVAYNGAEPVRADTLRRFVEAYRPHGLSERAIYPCYGLAEATLFVSGPQSGQGWSALEVSADALEIGSAQAAEPGEDRDRRRALVSCGAAANGHTLWIVDPQSKKRLAEGEVGEIWLRGPSISKGYWLRPDADAAIFQTCADDAEGGKFCRTGDLGFLRGGQLYVTGRLKEVLIVRGRNHYPQDIEHTIQQSWSGFVKGGGAAFTRTGNDGDILVVVQEVARTALRRYRHDEAFESAREAIAREHGLTLAELVPIKPATLAKTSSGKIRRGWMKSLHEKGELALVAGYEHSPRGSDRAVDAAPLGEIAACLTEMNIPLTGLKASASLMQAGLDSLQLIDLQSRLQRRLGADVPLEWLFGDDTLEQLETRLQSVSSASGDEAVVDLPDEPAWLTPYQLSIWLRQQRDPVSPMFNLGLALEFDAIEPPALEDALRTVLAEHPLLCSRIAYEGDRPYWSENGVAMVDLVDAAGWPDDKVQHFLFEFKNRAFDLEQDAPLRCAILTRGRGRSLLALTAHHVAIDLQGASALIERLLALMQRAPAEIADPFVDRKALAELNRYADKAGAPLPQNDRVHAADTLWFERLAQGGELDLGLGLQPAGENHPAVYEASFDAERWGELKAAASKSGCTLNTLLATAFAALLHRYSGQERISLGIPVSVRSPSLTDWPGNAVNILPLPLAFDAGTSLKQLIEQSAPMLGTLMRQRHRPYLSLLEQVRAQAPAAESLYSAIFVCQPEAADDSAMQAFASPGRWARHGGMRYRSLAIASAASQAPLSLLIFPKRSGALLQLEVDSRLIPAHFAERVLAHFQALLASLLDDIERPLASADYLPWPELHRQWREWNTQGFGPAPSGSLVERFLCQVEMHPQREAVADATQSLSYADVHRLALRYCGALQAGGVQPGDRIGIALPRDVHLPAAILGVLMCGAAYVPLDLDYPPERLRYILDNSEARWVVTVEDHRRLFEDAGAATLLYAPELAPGAPVLPTADQIAYVLYTSGSTGQPKGVRVAHGNVLALLDWAESALSPRERRRMLASTSVCFDLSVFEFFVPLCLGTSCVVINKILDLIEQPWPDVSLINTVPSAIDALLSAGTIADSVEVALVAGEPFRQVLVEQLYRGSRVRRVLDLYGPTEDTVYSTWAERRPGEPETIGRVLPGSRAYVLDANQQPVPIGLPGELYLAGNGLSDGYQGRPDLTAQAFYRPERLAHLEERCYRTGDIVRQLPDGRFVYLGRRDHQIKIRGYRIELSEVEAALRAHPAVRQAVAHAVITPQGQSALAAYLVWTDETAADLAGLRAHLEYRLPAYMRPAHFIALEALPRTLNGKVDRKALPQPDFEAQDAPALQGELELQLAEVWEQVLHSRPRQREAHFIDLGGNSLAAVKLRMEIQRRFAVDLPLSVLFSAPTLAAQAELIENLAQADLIGNRAQANPMGNPSARAGVQDGEELEEFEL